MSVENIQILKNLKATIISAHNSCGIACKVHYTA